MAFVVVLHLSPDHESNLTEILQHETDLPVQVATDECPLEADHIYVIPPQHEIQVEASMLRLSDRSSDHRPDTIDALLGSLAAAYKRQAIGIILSGTGGTARWGSARSKATGELPWSSSPAMRSTRTCRAVHWTRA